MKKGDTLNFTVNGMAIEAVVTSAINEFTGTAKMTCVGGGTPKKTGTKRGMKPAHKNSIKEMKRLRKKCGYSFKEVADYMNQMNVPTFSGKGKWHAQTIHRLLSN